MAGRTPRLGGRNGYCTNVYATSRAVVSAVMRTSQKRRRRHALSRRTGPLYQGGVPGTTMANEGVSQPVAGRRLFWMNSPVGESRISGAAPKRTRWSCGVLRRDRRSGRQEETRAEGRRQTHPRPRSRRKSGAQKKKRYQKKAAQKRQVQQEHLQRQWEEWDALPPEVQKLRPEMKPKQPRPTNEG